MTFKPFPSIEGFAHVVSNQQKRAFLHGSAPLLYGLKIKLHGTNAAVRIDKDGTVTAQSRKRNITPDDDNFDFAKFVEANKDFFERMAGAEEIVIFGEWAGAGVQNTDAVNKIGRRMFFPFAVQMGDLFYTDTDIIEEVFDTAFLPIPDDIVILPHMAYVEIDFSKGDSVRNAVDEINQIVEEIEKRDPFIFERFGIDDVGEGVVGAPLDMHGMMDDTFRNLTFKAKAQNHRGRKAKAAASGRFELSDDARTMALSYVTEARCRQALREALDDELDIRKMKDFLAWMGGDIKKESAAELEAAGLEWKQIAGVVAAASAQWLKDEIENFGQKAA